MNARLAKQDQIDSKSATSNSRKKIQKTSLKPFDSTTGKQQMIAQKEDGTITSVPEEYDLMQLWEEYDDALRGCKAKEKAWRKKRDAMKETMTPK